MIEKSQITANDQTIIHDKGMNLGYLRNHENTSAGTLYQLRNYAECYTEYVAKHPDPY